MTPAALCRACLFPCFLKGLVTTLAAVITLVCHAVKLGNITRFFGLMTLFASFGFFRLILPHVVTFFTLHARLGMDRMIKSDGALFVLESQGLSRGLNRARIHHCYCYHRDNKHPCQKSIKELSQFFHPLSFFSMT